MDLCRSKVIHMPERVQGPVGMGSVLSCPMVGSPGGELQLLLALIIILILIPARQLKENGRLAFDLHLGEDFFEASLALQPDLIVFILAV
jgi:hypothetical protein